jgi:hypothetical protein
MRNQRQNKNNTGAAMLVVVIFFLIISMVIISGLVSPSIRSVQAVIADLDSKKSYFLAESGVEDVFYRLLTGKTLDSSETIALDSNFATTTVTSGGDSVEILALGDVSDYQRQIGVTLATSSGVSFNYGVQVGQGGISISGSGRVNGNVYANGPISGDSSSAITGTAISGNSPEIFANQANGSGTPPYDVFFGNNNSTQDIAQSFQVSSEVAVNQAEFYIKKTGLPSNATVKITTDNNGSPSSTVLASGTLLASSITTSYGWIPISFTTNPILQIGTTYWLVIDASTSSSKYYIIGASLETYENGLGKIGRLGSSWGNTTPAGLDYFFKISLGGFTGLIYGTSGSQWNQLHVGTVSGTAQAHTVNYTNATGEIYCQVGTGNNKTCLSQPDPAYIAFSVSEANIEDWKAEAEAGGIYNGNYSVGWAGATLGPKKIVGNLSVSGGGILTVTGTLWVTGNITLNGGGTIQLASSYGSDDGVLVADGSISISGGGHATGSGVEGSYIMMLSTSTSSSALSVSGGAGAVIVYAPYGTINISGGASLKQATGYQMLISGGSSITYESGLANSNFSSGPSGSWSISGWGEN